ncbi:MAG: hypothetical protein HQK49_07580 [Oligoflexia bacterium]|nr:hypothetical protein [Oligoflexia bacterium]
MKKTMFLGTTISVIISLFYFVSFVCFVFAADQDLLPNTKWILIKDESGYKVFKGEVAHESGIYPLKIEATIAFPLAKVLTVLDSTERKHEWVPNMKEAKVIQQISPFEKIEKGTYDAPWPVSDREFLVRIKADVDFKGKFAKATMESTTIADVAVETGCVRGETYNGDVFLKAVDADHTYLQMILFNNFKGLLPVWIVNMVQKDWPTNFVARLKNQLERKDIEVDKKLQPLL